MNTKQRAPGPRGSLVMGNLEEYKRDPITMLLKLQQQYGDIARNRLGPFLTHALAHPDHVQYVLQENHRNYVRGRFYESFKLFFGDGLLTTDGDFWRRHRRAVQPLFHKKQVEEHIAAVGDAALALVRRWQALPSGEPVEVVEEMMHLSLSMLGLMVFNTDISQHAQQVGPSVRFGIAAMMPQGNMNDFIPRWMPTPFNRRIAQARRNLDVIIGKIVEDHRAGHCEASDVISLLLNSRHPETGTPMSEQEVHDEVMTVFLAGHETTGSGMAWALYALAQYPAVLRRLRDELDARLGGRAPTLEDLEALPYLTQVVDEVLRVYPPIWGFTRDLAEDDEIGGFHIPAGSSVFMSPYVTHRHPAFWNNPEAFDPENFASNAPNRHRFGYFPFGGGMRKCIGFQTALLQMRVLTAVVAQHFDLNALPGHPIERGALISLRPLQGIRLIVKPRQRQSPTQRPDPGMGAASPTSDAACGAKPQREVTSGCPFAEAPALPSSGPLSDEVVVVKPANPEPRSAPVLPPAATGMVPALRFTWFPSEIEALPSTPSPALGGKRVVIVNGRAGTAERVAVALLRACAKATVFAPGVDADPVEAAKALVKQSGPFDGIVDLGLEESFSLAAANQWEMPMRHSIAMLQACYGDWEVEESASRLFYMAVTWMDGSMGYGDAVAQPLGGLWSGLAKTLPQEVPNCNVRVLDVAPNEAGRVDQLVVRELYRWGLFEVGYRAGRRYTLKARRSELPALPAGSAPDLGPGDVVLFSGGARGIGLLCAKAMAGRYGCTVIITGREPLPDGSEPWMTLDDAGFSRYGQEQLRLATRERTPKRIREELARLQRRRELKASLDEIASCGLPVQYRVCDVTDAAAVRALCGELRDVLRVVVHNAGVDRPVRLPQKSADSFIDTVRTKVGGFANLCAAVADCPRLVQFCNVGSLTGRWGGMTGETDYAAANEALARLGLWAQRHALPCSVKTLVWPTWDSVGMITNFAVTKRYVTPMAADEGVRHWLREFASRDSGEVMFMGAVGPALTPVQLKGFSPILELPNIADLVTRHHHAGEPLRFRPFRSFATRYRIDPIEVPFAQAFRFGGRHALPASMLIEHACSVGAWVMPATVEPQRLDALINVAVHLHALPFEGEPEAGIDVLSEAKGYLLGDLWHVDVHCAHAATQVGLLSLTLVYRAGAAPSVRRITWPAEGLMAKEALPSSTAAAWNAHVLPAADWQVPLDRSKGIGRIGCAVPADASDLWAIPFPPDLRLPANHLENILRAVIADNTDSGEALPHEWRIDRMALSGLPPSSADAVVQYTDGRFDVVDALGQVLLELQGVTLETVSSVVPAAPPATEALAVSPLG
ncbi:cytochrome P450 [Paraburkholderia ginsengisoli]|uniref:Cytochrome P450 n=1 Tax=Paraburkholderia ginsengisoli TaxID=311231 RepID=A0A7T4N9Y6_9BURK|nr:cytochrome P450 [Paraburkholderia ginsengisoli]QQC67913.1 cytochrome P450 [Paraburkholderia ginsengisoli]